jgi:type II restriction/modification system DNA methylase subunit YeeA
MDTSKLKKFAQFARRSLMAQVGAKLESVLAEGAAARREHPEAMRKLDAAIANEGKAHVIERVAYIWFNRFSALRFMDLNDLNPVRVVSPLVGQFQPEILAEAKAGNIDEDRVPETVRAQIASLLDGRTPSPDAQAEAYRLLLVAICNDWHRAMPFLFERIDDFTELLLPEDLLSNSSILAYLREAMTPDACDDVEVIGWLYQFYISEKKDDVFAGLKKNIKINAENIPAATQLFTPHWIVRYLVENSLGRLWMLNRPASKLAARMDYYIAPEEPETDFLKICKPEEIKVCDPACGSGHMLTYAFDLLYAIYEEEGHDPAQIPALILQHNLTGVEIDDRAGALAAFALAMKAAARLGRRRFLRIEAKPDIVVLSDITFTPAEMREVAAVVQRDLFTDELRETLLQFEQAKNYGSLIVPKLRDPAETLRVVAARDFGGDLLLKEVQERVVAVLRMADALSPKYYVVVANPPYMGGSGMNGMISDFVKERFSAGKADLFSAFMLRIQGLATNLGRIGLMTPNVWMYIGSYEGLRTSIGEVSSLTNLVELPLSGFKGATVQICAFNIVKGVRTTSAAFFIRLVDFRGDDAEMAARTLEAISDKECEWMYRADTEDFEAIPGRPIAYAASTAIKNTFKSGRLDEFAEPRLGMATADNNRFLRFWHEVGSSGAKHDAVSRQQAQESRAKWFPYQKGGDYRKWYGNLEYYVNWENDGADIQNFKDIRTGKVRSHNYNMNYIFQNGVTWCALTSGKTSARISQGALFDNAGSSMFVKTNITEQTLLGLINSNVMLAIFPVISPTLNYQPGDMCKVPAKIDSSLVVSVTPLVSRIIGKAKSDWDAYETSWDFTALPLLSPNHRAETLEATYARLRAHWQGMTDEMQQLEEDNNRIFIDAYGLQDELTPEVPIEEITLTCNPAYRYGVKGIEDDRETRLRADTMAEFLSYAAGCMFGRYSLDAPGLILANQGETLADYRARVPEPSFLPDEDNVIPVLESDWFADDIVDRFRKFLRVTFGDTRFQENLAFIEESLGKNGKSRSVRDYFVKDFFSDHVKRYKKRPIYWLFSSPKGTFNALIYMHRYRPETIDTLLNEYLRPFRSKLEAHKTAQERLSISADATQAQRTAALKEVQTVTKQVAEIDAWERDVVYPLATQRIEIDLDDGVKANYPKFAGALKPIKGVEEADD